MSSITSSITFSFFLLLLFYHPRTTTCTTTTTPYFSKTTFFPNYQKMLANFKIFIYPPPLQQNIPPKNNSSPFSIFYNSLISSHFLTHNPNQANVFFLPFNPMPTRSLASHIQTIRTAYPYWNRSLGADHFFFSCHGVGPGGVRNVVELKKNAVQITCFPSPARELVPHKDITLPPIMSISPAENASDSTRPLGYWRFAEVQAGVGLINGLRNDDEFLIESEPSDEGVYDQRVKQSKFCIFIYDLNNDGSDDGVVRLTSALAHGCVPVVLTDRPINDLPLMDVIRWSEIGLFVGSNMGPHEFKQLLIRTCENGEYEKMKSLGVAAAHHFAWNEGDLQPYDAFYMVVYQLWVRRHAIRYSRWENIESTEVE